MRLAVIGLGAMGLPIAQRLAGATWLSVAAYDLDPERMSLLEAPVRRASSVEDATHDADAVLTILPADEHVLGMTDTLVRTLRPGTIYADLSTIAPSTIESTAATLDQVGVTTVSVSITRGTSAAVAGTLGLYVDRDEPSLRPALDTIASDIRVVGTLGAAKAVKLANNVVVAVGTIAICEALVLGRLLGHAHEAVVERLRAEGVDSWVLEHHVARNVLGGDLGPGHFSTRNMAKDVRLFLALAAEHGVPSATAAAAAACYRGTIAAGFGDDYHPVVVRWLEQASGAGVRAARVADGRALDALSTGVSACQALTNIDALRVLERYGVTRAEAAGHLGSGSAANASLSRVADTGELEMAAFAATAVESLDAVAVLADAASAPSFVFEAARASAIGLRGTGTTAEAADE